MDFLVFAGIRTGSWGFKLNGVQKFYETFDTFSSTSIFKLVVEENKMVLYKDNIKKWTGTGDVTFPLYVWGYIREQYSQITLEFIEPGKLSYLLQTFLKIAIQYLIQMVFKNYFSM